MGADWWPAFLGQRSSAEVGKVTNHQFQDLDKVRLGLFKHLHASNILQPTSDGLHLRKAPVWEAVGAVGMRVLSVPDTPPGAETRGTSVPGPFGASRCFGPKAPSDAAGGEEYQLGTT